MASQKWTLSEMKELILGLLALFWGVLFCLPGNTFTNSSRIDIMALYAEDWVWGILLVVAGYLLAFAPREKYFLLRKSAIFFLFCFWCSMAVLIIVRSATNGLQVSDFLITSWPIVIASLHVTLYARLVNVK